MSDVVFEVGDEVTVTSKKDDTQYTGVVQTVKGDTYLVVRSSDGLTFWVEGAFVSASTPEPDLSGQRNKSGRFTKKPADENRLPDEQPPEIPSTEQAPELPQG